MSWQDYITNLTASKGCPSIVQEAAICGIADCTMWACTPGCNITKPEIIALIGDRSCFFQAGPTVSGVKCRLLQDGLDDPLIKTIKMKTGQDCSGASYFVCIGKSKQTLVYVKGTKDAQAGDLNTKVCNLIDYLISVGF